MTSALEHVRPQYELFEDDVPPAPFAELSRAQRISWDIETSGLSWASDRVALCQLYASDLPVVMVRIGSSVPRNLRLLLENRQVLKVFHHAMFDLRFMAHHWNVRPANVACTKIAAKLLLPEKPDDQRLQSLLDRYLGLRISKEQQTSNWFAPAYSKAQIAYAIEDVVHLVELLDVMTHELQARGLRSLAERCFEHLPARVELELGGFGDVFQY